jgi:hypothetical protein
MGIYAVQNLLGNQYGRVYKKSTHETLRIEGASVEFIDDFLGTVVATTAAGVKGWTFKGTGAEVTPVVLANQSTGVIQFGHDVTNEKQEAGIYLGDSLNFNLDKGVIFEARTCIHTTGTLQAEYYFGIANAYVEGPIAEADAGPTIHALFNYDAALTPTIHTDDAVTDNNAIATGVTSVADTYAVFRIDASVLTSVKFYINGARVGAATTFDMTNGTDVVVQPFIMAHKETSAGLGIYYLDYVKMWQLAR